MANTDNNYTPQDLAQDTELPEGYVAPKVALVGGTYYELRAEGHRRLPDGIDYPVDMQGIAPSYKGNVLKKMTSKKKRNGGRNRRIKTKRK